MPAFKTLFKVNPFHFVLIAFTAFALSGCGGSDYTSPTTVPGNVACNHSAGFCADYGYVSDAASFRAACMAAGYSSTSTSCPGGYTSSYTYATYTIYYY